MDMLGFLYELFWRGMEALIWDTDGQCPRVHQEELGHR